MQDKYMRWRKGGEGLNLQSVRSGDKEDEHEVHATSYSSKWKRGYVFFRPKSWLLPNKLSIVI